MKSLTWINVRRDGGVWKIWSALACVLVGLAGAASVAAEVQYIVVPNECENQYGNSRGRFPFATTQHIRLQQVYAASEFGAVSLNGGWITAVGFRLDGATWTFRADMASLRVNLSTTAKGPDQLSAYFAENIGADETVVFGPAPRDMTTPSWNPDWTESLRLPLTTPFFYHPMNGNLLLDVFNHQAAREEEGWLDATSKQSDPVSSLTMNVASSEGLRDTAGLVTRFEIIPAPASPALGVRRAGGALILCWPTNSAGFVLESLNTLGASNQWAPLTTAPAVADTNYFVTNTLSAPSQFYRLRYVVSP